MDTPDLPLAAEFPPASEADWRQRVEEVLKGRPFERLIAKTHDGLPIAPLYARASAAHPLVARAAGPWQIMQRADHPDPGAANAQLLADLESGATGISLICAGAPGSNGYGIDASPAGFARILRGVHLDAGVALELELPPFVPDPARDLAALVRATGIAPKSATIRFALDPLAAAAVRGAMPRPWTEQAKAFAGIVGELAAQGFGGPFAAADGRAVHAAGGSDAQELAFALASAVAYLRALEAAGVALASAAPMIFFRLAADADQFLTIAKLRALRKLWARVETACDLAPTPAFVAAETSWRMMTRRDPHVNLLRTTVAAFAAVVGGADAITVLPFTNARGLPDPFARRLARNTQLLLQDEASLARVADPAAGSGAAEAITQALCERAWALFQTIERAGGVANALTRGDLQAEVAAVRAQRQNAIAHRTDILTGTTEFAALAEAPVSVLNVPARPPRHGIGQTVASLAALTAIRLAEPFERLRDLSDRVAATTHARPRVFLAALGTPADSTARVTFARNFFAAGGIDATGGDVSASEAEMVAAFKASGAALACLCSSDAVYAASGIAAAEALTQAGLRRLYLAGRPSDSAALQRAGVETFIFAGCDALATLEAAHDIVEDRSTRSTMGQDR